MKTKLKIAPLALGLALLAPVPAQAQSDRSRNLGPLAGGWRMTSLEVGTPGNLERIPYSGQIIFTRPGTVSVQAMNPDTDAPDTPFTLGGYEAFYGNVTVRTNRQAARTTRARTARSGTFTVTVQSAAARSLIGQRLTRNWRVTGDRMVLTPTDPADGFRVTYERF